MNVETREKLYEGKAKIVYETNRPDLIIQYFKDDATASILMMSSRRQSISRSDCVPR